MPMSSQREQGATLVEFALVAPILFLILFGVLEVGRLVGTNQQVQMAAREGARYGVGIGTSTNGDARYTDCAEIREATRRLSNLADLADSDIVIQRDGGPSTTVTTICNPSDPASSDFSRGDRIIVTVTHNFSFVVPLIDDFFGGGVTLRATERRTIFIPPT